MFTRWFEFAGRSTPPQRSMWRDGLGHVATRGLQLLIVITITAVIVYGMVQLSLVIIPVVIALILAAAIYPVLRWMRRRGIASIVATWLAILGLTVVIGGIVWLIVAAVRNQWGELADSAADGLNELQAYFEQLPVGISDAQIEDFRNSLVDFVTSSSFGTGALAGVSAATSFVTGLFLMIVVLFFFMKDGPRIWEFLLRPFTGAEYERAKRVGATTVDVLGSYVRGTATVAAVDAIAIGVALWIIGVPLALPLAVIIFISAFIPLVGATVAGAIAALVALVANGPVAALIVVIVVVAVNQLEGNFLQPVVMARSLNLHALVVLLALTIGTILGGIVGAVLSVPIAAVAWGILQVWNGPGVPLEMVRKKRDESV